MRFGSVCSGIEAASVAWLPLGWTCAFMAEIDAFPRAVLSHHYPDTPLHGDFTTIKAGQYGTVDVLVGGTPCQSFSVAGLRGGLADERGNLALEYLRLADRLRPQWLLWENVPGVRSSYLGRDFGAFLGGLGELGYGWAYRSLDAQYFNLAQRRERVFVVGYLGDWRRAAAVLFEPASLRGDPPPSRETRQRTADTPAPRPGSGGIANAVPGRPWPAHREDSDTLVAFDSLAGGNTGFAIGDVPGSLRGSGHHNGHAAIAYGGNNQSGPIDVATAVNAHGGPHGRQDFESETFITHSLRADGFDASEDGTGRGIPLVATALRSRDVARGVDSDCTDTLVAFQDRFRGDDGRGYDRPPPVTKNVTGALETVKPWNVATHSMVRRLTVTECERLMGVPDGYTDVPYRGKRAADGPRYRSLGNSMAVPVMRWIGNRIDMVHNAKPTRIGPGGLAKGGKCDGTHQTPASDSRSDRDQGQDRDHSPQVGRGPAQTIGLVRPLAAPATGAAT